MAALALDGLARGDAVRSDGFWAASGGGATATICRQSAGRPLAAGIVTGDALVLVLEGGCGWDGAGRSGGRGSLFICPSDSAARLNFHEASRVVHIRLSDDIASDQAINRLFSERRVLDMSGDAMLLARIEGASLVRDAAASYALLGAVFDLLGHCIRTAGVRRRPDWLRRVVDRLDGDPAHPPALQELALEAEVHPSHLARAFREAYGETVGEYARRRRIERAAAALAIGRSIVDVALEAGFCDQAHFTRAFRQHLGKTPALYVRTLRA